MSMYHKTLLAAVLCGAVSVAVAAPEGGATHTKIVNGKPQFTTVAPGSSSTLPFGAGKAGLAFSNDGGKSWSTSINLENGPVKHIRRKHGNTPINGNNTAANVNGTQNPRYLTLKDVAPVVGFFYNPTLGQVWYENRAHNTEVYSVRQMAEPKIPAAPKFGGLVIAKVPNMSDGNVFFGEWAPRAGNPPQNSTDLNMNSNQRTVWYVGDNPTGNTAGLASATYNVVGINKHTPGQNDFYTGSVTATFGRAAQGTMSGSIARSGDSVNFNGVNIRNSDGTFRSGNGNNQGISGRFYGSGAAAMAGIATRNAGVGDDVAFGGRKR